MFTPYTGTVYSFKFKTPLDTLNGIYQVLRIMTYDEMISDNIKLANIWVLAGSTEIELENEINTPNSEIKSNKILKLQSVKDENIIIHIPYAKLAYEPDFNVKQYHRLIVALDLGVYKNMDEVNYIKNVIDETAEAVLGVKKKSDIFSTNYEWMLESEYNEILKDREKYKSTIINLFSENNRLRNELTNAKTLIEKYETTIVNLSK